MFFKRTMFFSISAILALSACSSEDSNSELQHSSNAPTTTLAKSENSRLTHIGSYFTGSVSDEGGIAEIVAYNSENQKIYLVNGALGSVDIVDADKLSSGKFTQMKLHKRIDIAQLAAQEGFTYGDVTSVDVNEKRDLVAIAVQAQDYAADGKIVLLDYEGNFVACYDAGVQPDMLTFSEDGNYILSANEGEPRMGYANGIDPKGSVTIVNLQKQSAETVGFELFDTQKDSLAASGVLFNKGLLPSTDFEPEYIAIDANKAYVVLQEANAIATLDIQSGVFTSVKSLGFKDYASVGIDVDKDEIINIAPHNDLKGVYMPDGIALYQANGKSYILSANEGDAREWEEFEDITNDLFKLTKKVETLDPSKKDGALEEGKFYLLGGRSFSIFDADSMSLTYDSGSDFEDITATLMPSIFNTSHDNNKIDSRSNKKGPEPEYITALEIGGATYAFIGLERFGGVMMYDVSDPQNAHFADYINTRNTTSDTLAQMGDLGPEGLRAVEAAKSPTNKPILFVANEISGTIAVFEIV